MSEEEEPEYCPFCCSEDTDTKGQTSLKQWVIYCRGCERDVLIKDVTGKVTVTVEVIN